MSTLNEEIVRLETAKINISNVLTARGVSVPSNATLDTYHNLINSIKGGTSSEEVTATKANVLAGTTTITSDSNDEIVEGTMPNYSGTQQDTDSVYIANGNIYMSVKNQGYYAGNSDLKAPASDFGNAAQANVLSGSTFTSSNGIKLAGAMKNLTTSTTITHASNNATPVILGDAAFMSTNTDGVLRAEVRYNSENGFIQPNSLFGVPASAMAAAGGLTADKMPVGKSAFGINGTLACNSAINFSAAALSSTSIRISWTNPSKGPWTGVFIQMSTSGYSGTSGGTRVYTGRGNSTSAGGSNYVDITGLDAGTTYYFTCTSYVSGLGNGSSYNVNAKTKGLMLYNYGAKPDILVSLTDSVTFESSYIQLTNSWSGLRYKGSIDWNSYTKVCSIASLDSRSSGYNYVRFSFSLVGGDASGSISGGVFTYVSATGTNITYTISDLSKAKNITHTQVAFEWSTCKKSTGGSESNFTGKVYKLWLE